VFQIKLKKNSLFFGLLICQPYTVHTNINVQWGFFRTAHIAKSNGAINLNVEESNKILCLQK